jgi:hypothetical protein
MQYYVQRRLDAMIPASWPWLVQLPIKLQVSLLVHDEIALGARSQEQRDQLFLPV